MKYGDSIFMVFTLSDDRNMEHDFDGNLNDNLHFKFDTYLGTEEIYYVGAVILTMF